MIMIVSLTLLVLVTITIIALLSYVQPPSEAVAMLGGSSQYESAIIPITIIFVSIGVIAYYMIKDRKQKCSIGFIWDAKKKMCKRNK